MKSATAGIESTCPFAPGAGGTSMHYARHTVHALLRGALCTIVLCTGDSSSGRYRGTLARVVDKGKLRVIVPDKDFAGLRSDWEAVWTSSRSLKM